MKVFFILLTLLIKLNHLNAQETNVEIYLVSENVIITGVVTDSIGDSIFILTDKKETLAFAKSGMQGLNYAVSKQLKKLQLQLIRAETKHFIFEYPGKYQMSKGELTKGKALYWIAGTGITCVVIGAVGLIIGFPVWMYAVIGGAYKTAEIAGLISLGSLYTLLAGTSTAGIASLYTQFEIIKDVATKVKTRYYYSGDSYTTSGRIILPAN